MARLSDGYWLLLLPVSVLCLGMPLLVQGHTVAFVLLMLAAAPLEILGLITWATRRKNVRAMNRARAIRERGQ